MLRRLAIVGDDFGYCENRNRGIEECFLKNGITETSLLMNSNYIQHAHSIASQTKLPVALHFNISEGRPVSEPMAISTLIGENGMFKDKGKLLYQSENAQIDADHSPTSLPLWVFDCLMMTAGKTSPIDKLINPMVYTELKAQLEKFREAFGIYPYRVDGHQHTHTYPIIRNVFAKTLEEHGVKYTRLPTDYSMLQECEWMEPGVKSFLIQVFNHSVKATELFREHRLRTADAFIGCSTMNFQGSRNLTIENLEMTLSYIPEDAKTCELMVHPGYPCVANDGGCGAGPDDFSKDIVRKWELEFLISKEFKDLLTERNIEICPYSQLFG